MEKQVQIINLHDYPSHSTARAARLERERRAAELERRDNKVLTLTIAGMFVVAGLYAVTALAL